jgi:nickel/cobalt transporter (NiCoT) family protein
VKSCTFRQLVAASMDEGMMLMLANHLPTPTAPLRKITYNLTTTALSIAVALLVGSIELLQVLIGMLDLHGQFFDAVTALNFGVLGYIIVGMFLLAWGLSVAVFRFGRGRRLAGAR